MGTQLCPWMLHGELVCVAAWYTSATACGCVFVCAHVHVWGCACCDTVRVTAATQLCCSMLACVCLSRMLDSRTCTHNSEAGTSPSTTHTRKIHAIAVTTPHTTRSPCTVFCRHHCGVFTRGSQPGPLTSLSLSFAAQRHTVRRVAGAGCLWRQPTLLHIQR